MSNLATGRNGCIPRGFQRFSSITSGIGFVTGDTNAASWENHQVDLCAGVHPIAYQLPGFGNGLCDCLRNTAQPYAILHAIRYTNRANLLLEFGKSTPRAIQVNTPNPKPVIGASHENCGGWASPIEGSNVKTAPTTTLRIAIHW